MKSVPYQKNIKDILFSDCQYPKWFNDSIKENAQKIAVNDIENSWACIWSSWNAKGVSVEAKHKLMIKYLVNQTSEVAKSKNNPDLSKNLRFINLAKNTVKSVNETLKNKNIDEIIELIREFTKKSYFSADLFHKFLFEFFGDDLTNIDSKLKEIRENILFTSKLEVI